MTSLADAYLNQAQHNIATAEYLIKDNQYSDWVFWAIFYAIELTLKGFLIACGNKNTKKMKHDFYKIMGAIPEEKKEWINPLSNKILEIHRLYQIAGRYPVESKENETGETFYQLPAEKIPNLDILIEYLQVAKKLTENLKKHLSNIENK